MEFKNRQMVKGNTSDDERRKANSPDPNCSICLSKMTNKSFTDRCFHMFCFECILEWSRRNPVCPLCKESFQQIFYNIKSDCEYDVYDVVSHSSSLNLFIGRSFPNAHSCSPPLITSNTAFHSIYHPQWIFGGSQRTSPSHQSSFQVTFTQPMPIIIQPSPSTNSHQTNYSPISLVSSYLSPNSSSNIINSSSSSSNNQATNCKRILSHSVLKEYFKREINLKKLIKYILSKTYFSSSIRTFIKFFLSALSKHHPLSPEFSRKINGSQNPLILHYIKKFIQNISFFSRPFNNNQPIINVEDETNDNNDSVEEIISTLDAVASHSHHHYEDRSRHQLTGLVQRNTRPCHFSLSLDIIHNNNSNNHNKTSSHNGYICISSDEDDEEEDVFEENRNTIIDLEEEKRKEGRSKKRKFVSDNEEEEEVGEIEVTGENEETKDKTNNLFNYITDKSFNVNITSDLINNKDNYNNSTNNKIKKKNDTSITNRTNIITNEILKKKNNNNNNNYNISHHSSFNIDNKINNIDKNNKTDIININNCNNINIENNKSKEKKIFKKHHSGHKTSYKKFIIYEDESLDRNNNKNNKQNSCTMLAPSTSQLNDIDDNVTRTNNFINTATIITSITTITTSTNTTTTAITTYDNNNEENNDNNIKDSVKKEKTKNSFLERADAFVECASSSCTLDIHKQNSNSKQTINTFSTNKISRKINTDNECNSGLNINNLSTSCSNDNFIVTRSCQLNSLDLTCFNSRDSIFNNNHNSSIPSIVRNNINNIISSSIINSNSDIINYNRSSAFHVFEKHNSENKKIHKLNIYNNNDNFNYSSFIKNITNFGSVGNSNNNSCNSGIHNINSGDNREDYNNMRPPDIGHNSLTKKNIFLKNSSQHYDKKSIHNNNTSQYGNVEDNINNNDKDNVGGDDLNLIAINKNRKKEDEVIVDEETISLNSENSILLLNEDKKKEEEVRMVFEDDEENVDENDDVIIKKVVNKKIIVLNN